MKTITLYETRDGECFETEAAALAHYAEHPEAALVFLTDADLEDALEGRAPDIADAIEKLGRRLQTARIERGDKKRVRRNGAESADESAGEPRGEIDGSAPVVAP